MRRPFDQPDQSGDRLEGMTRHGYMPGRVAACLGFRAQGLGSLVRHRGIRVFFDLVSE